MDMYSQEEVDVLIGALSAIVKTRNRYDARIAQEAIVKFNNKHGERRARHDENESEHEHRCGC